VIFAAGEGGRSTITRLSIESITARGVSCQSAGRFIEMLARRTTAGAPEGYKCVRGATSRATGYTSHTCSRPRRTISYLERVTA
jgi:hypothetical protein